MIPVDTIFGAGPRIQTDSHVVQGGRVNLACNTSRWREGFFRRFVGDELKLPSCQFHPLQVIGMCARSDLPTKRSPCL